MMGQQETWLDSAPIEGHSPSPLLFYATFAVPLSRGATAMGKVVLYTGKILGGAKPADLAAEHEIGAGRQSHDRQGTWIDGPELFLLRADEVIE